MFVISHKKQLWHCELFSCLFTCLIAAAQLKKVYWNTSLKVFVLLLINKEINAVKIF